MSASNRNDKNDQNAAIEWWNDLSVSGLWKHIEDNRHKLEKLNHFIPSNKEEFFNTNSVSASFVFALFELVKTPM